MNYCYLNWLSANAAIALVGAVAALLPACGDPAAVTATAAADAGKTGGAADAANDATAPAAAPTLTGASHTKAPYVEISGSWQADSQRLLVNVWVGGCPDLLGIAGHLRYDPTKLQLMSSDSLPLTEESATSGFGYRAVLKEVTPGQLLTGTARFRSQSHPMMYPEGAVIDRSLWLKLQFAVVAPGTSTIGFDPLTQLARTSKGDLLQPEWLTAEVTVPAAVGGGK